MLRVHSGTSLPSRVSQQEPLRQPPELPDRVDVQNFDLNSIQNGILHVSVPLKEGEYLFPGKFAQARVQVDAGTMAWLTVRLDKNPKQKLAIAQASIELSRPVRVVNPSSAYEKPGLLNTMKDLFAEVRIRGINLGLEGEILFQGEMKKGFSLVDIQEDFKPDMLPKVDLCLENLLKKKKKAEGDSPKISLPEMFEKMRAILGEAKCSVKLEADLPSLKQISFSERRISLGAHLDVGLSAPGEATVKTNEQFVTGLEHGLNQLRLQGNIKLSDLINSQPKATGTCSLDGDFAPTEMVFNVAENIRVPVVLGERGNFVRVDAQVENNALVHAHLGLKISKVQVELNAENLKKGTLSYHVDLGILRPFGRKIDYEFFPDNRLALHPQNSSVSELIDPVNQFVWCPGRISNPLSPAIGEINSDLWRANAERISGAPIRRNNRVTLLEDGKTSFPKRLEMIQQAQHSIYVQSLIFKDDSTGMQLAQALVEARARGVQVYVIVDSFGNSDSIQSFMQENKAYKLMQENGINFRAHTNLAFQGLSKIISVLRKKAIFEDIDNWEDLIAPKQILSTLNLLSRIAQGTVGPDVSPEEREIIKEGLYLMLGNHQQASSIIERLANVSQQNPLELQEIAEILSQILSLNSRWHEKYFVIDGQKAILGGMNLADEYMRGGFNEQITVANHTRPTWRDTDVLIEGSAARDSVACFARNWKILSGQEIDLSGLPESDLVLSAEGVDSDVQIIQSLPGSELVHPITNFKIEAIKSLKAGDKLYEASAYFMPVGALKPYVEALKQAAIRGVDVRILTNSKESTDLPKLNEAAIVCSYRELLRAGVRIFERTGLQTMHQKTAVYGDGLSMVGSFNLDNRSASLNTEDLVAIHGRDFASQITAMLVQDMALEKAKEVKLQEIEASPFLEELERTAWASLGDLM